MEEIRDRYPVAATGFVFAKQDDGSVLLDGQGAPAPMLAPAFVDELSLALLTGAPAVRVRNVAHVDFLGALHEYAAIRGVAYATTELGDGAATFGVDAVEATPTEPAAGAAGPAMERILLEGYVLDADQFWRLFHESNEALTPDSELSRRHAGSQLYDEHGNLIGEVSEETYLHLRSETGGSSAAVLA